MTIYSRTNVDCLRFMYSLLGHVLGLWRIWIHLLLTLQPFFLPTFRELNILNFYSFCIWHSFPTYISFGIWRLWRILLVSNKVEFIWLLYQTPFKNVLFETGRPIKRPFANTIWQSTVIYCVWKPATRLQKPDLSMSTFGMGTLIKGSF